jgi:hypothetical protein
VVRFIVITTVNPKSEAISAFQERQGWHLILVGDRKSQWIPSSGNLTFLSVEDQRRLGLNSVQAAPLDHYSRKNIGYLLAMRQGADVIYETDDDNFPCEHWTLPDFFCSSRCRSNHSFVNIYKHFEGGLAWPRGFPLDEVLSEGLVEMETVSPCPVGVWQGLTDRDPDVDALYRLLINAPIVFRPKPPVFLEQGFYCPFNSQNTFWHKKAFALLYLPTTVNPRCSDILRGYVAQRILWSQGMHLGFNQATTYQVRNRHDLMVDFEQEIPLYRFPKRLASILDSLHLDGPPPECLVKVYQALSAADIVSPRELRSLTAWNQDLKAVGAVGDTP